VNEEITRQLHEAAEAYQPDRARILARMERGAADAAVRHHTPSIARSWPKAAFTGLAIVGILATGGLAVAGIVRTPSPSNTAIAPAIPSPTAASRPTLSSRTTATSPALTIAPGSLRPTPPAGSRTQNGPLWSDSSIDPHSNVYWAQNNVTLKTIQPLTSLTVELRIAQTGGVRNTGSWQTLPGDDFTVTVQEIGGALVYRWVLKPGRTVPAGQHEFAGQYNHATGVRNAADDSYRVDAQTSGGSAAVWGGFTPAR
jgi:hypothetical protein